MKPTYNKVYIPLTIIAIIVLILQKFGPLAGQLRLAGFTLFAILCAALVIENRRTKGKIFAAIVYFFFGFVMYKFS
ncbi:hypothetical protein EVU96_19075 [Bacillus infantis]|uniref:Uncharacterized protein n=1 Tax=Bacillus infantis TaxID=324767 RepID=A0A5D4SFV9_9BACI|nr:hypothetical protein [Bacillus infantis]RYI26925.1 hypothetical protein EVU96_19075 [Bacillus infantis]TYS62160.1 hypothetical protein FZD47_18955 [Bacillus infantis]